MNRDDIVALFARRNEAWARKDAAGLAADHAENAVAESPIFGRIEGRARIRAAYENWFSSFADLTHTTKDVLVDGNKVAQFFTMRGTQSGPFGSVPATGRRLDFSGVILFTVGPDGLFTHDQRIYDVTGVLVQLGVLKAKPTDKVAS
jgi:steroid delta-isomerase-like uncharacterized protein